MSELGPAWLRIPSASALTAEASYLGEDATGLVSVAWDGREPMAVYTQSDGTFVRRGSISGGGSPEPLPNEAERVASISHVLHAAGGWVALGTREGIIAGRRDRLAAQDLRRGSSSLAANAKRSDSGGPRGLGPMGGGFGENLPERSLQVVSQRTDIRHLRVCPVPGGALVFCAGESDLGVIHVDEFGLDEVTHRIDARVTSLDVAGRGGRVAVVVGTETGTLAAELTRRGKMREKLHLVLRAEDTHPRITWMVSEFIVAGSLERGVRVERMEGGHLLMLDEVRGPYAFAFQQGRVLVAQIQTHEGLDVLALRSRDQRGGTLDAHSIPCHPAESERRRRTFAARRIFEQLGAALTIAGYRDRGAGEVSTRDLRAKLAVGDRVLQLHARLQDEGVELGIDLAPADPAPPPRSFARLARYFRRWTPEARAARDAIAARVAEVVGAGVEVLEAERTADVTSLTLHAREIPTAMVLVRWLKALGDL